MKKVVYPLANFLDENGYKVTIQKADGLCLLKSVHDCLAVNDCIIANTNFQKNTYVEKMRNEFTTNWERYSDYITSNLDFETEDDFMNHRFDIFDYEMEQYINTPGGWNSKLVDLVVPMLTNIFTVKILIFTPVAPNAFEVKSYLPYSSSHTRKIALRFYGNHYDSIVNPWVNSSSIVITKQL